MRIICVLNELDEEPVFILLSQLTGECRQTPCGVVASSAVEVITDSVWRLGGDELSGFQRASILIRSGMGIDVAIAIENQFAGR
jgi:hypothetical protein